MTYPERSETLHTLRTAAIRRRDILEALNAGGRSTAESRLVADIEDLLGKFSALPDVPLDVLDRLERCIVKAHTSNLLRLSRYGSADHAEAER